MKIKCIMNEICQGFKKKENIQKKIGIIKK